MISGQWFYRSFNNWPFFNKTTNNSTKNKGGNLNLTILVRTSTHSLKQICVVVKITSKSVQWFKS